MPNAHSRGLPPAGGSYTAILGPGRSSVREARSIVRKWLADYGIQDQTDTAELLVSELATNAIVHAGGRFRLTLTLGSDALRCEVADERRDFPVLPRRGDGGEPATGDAAADTDGIDGIDGIDGAADGEGGRGLLLIAALSHRWGCRVMEHGEGKGVWFELATTAPDDGGDGPAEAGDRNGTDPWCGARPWPDGLRPRSPGTAEDTGGREGQGRAGPGLSPASGGGRC
ncbi:ATP-binding protein [Streptomyces sp. NPDC050704]|uniref:ATP-binding protein n=1 Tax=Streptomyces sp. NPDC050704 TaxID=3157219 RepID=UPI003445760F